MLYCFQFVRNFVGILEENAHEEDHILQYSFTEIQIRSLPL